MCLQESNTTRRNNLRAAKDDQTEAVRPVLKHHGGEIGLSIYSQKFNERRRGMYKVNLRLVGMLLFLQVLFRKS